MRHTCWTSRSRASRWAEPLKEVTILQTTEKKLKPRKLLRSRRGEGYIDICVLVLCAMLVLGLAMRVLPAFIYKQQLDNFATELAREAEMAGRVGSETDRRAQVLREKTGLAPAIAWSRSGRIQLNEEFTVTVTMQYNLGLFGGFGSFPITLRAEASGKSEVYWKAA